MAVKELSCPHCKKTLSYAGGFHHDDSLNMLCGYCNGVVFPATKQEESRNRTALQGPAVAGGTYWQRKDCLPIKVNNTTPPVSDNNSVSQNGYEVYG
jgi:hypothetical protein